jgi:hypothetical protein
MAEDKKITELNALPAIDLDLGNDFLAIVDTDGNETKKITPDNLMYKAVKSDNVNNIVTLTLAEYDALTTPVSTTLYVITDL